MNPDRGSFPKSTQPETLDEKRLRFERWMIDTKQGDMPDPELAAILAQPNHDPSARAHSLERSVRARCWQCVGGSDDVGARDRIESCGATACALHPVRPYRTAAEIASAETQRLTRRPRVREYCRDCHGGARTPNVAREVVGCAVVSCALWPVRPQIKKTGEDRPEGSDAEFGAEAEA